MLLANEARELIGRLKILDRYPRAAEGETALVEALQSAETKPEAEYFIRRWIRENPKCPKPCDIYSALTKAKPPELPSLPQGKEAPPQEFFCTLCEDTGWYIVKSPLIPGTTIHYTAAKRCPHPETLRGTKPAISIG